MTRVQPTETAAELRRVTRRYRDRAARLATARAARDEAVRAAHTGGWSLAQVAAVTGLSRTQVHRIIQD